MLSCLTGPPPALLVLDAQMEEGALINVLKAVTRAKAWAKVPVLVIAAKGDEALLEAHETLIHDWITLPLDGREARRRVQMLLRYGKALQHPAL